MLPVQPPSLAGVNVPIMGMMHLVCRRRRTTVRALRLFGAARLQPRYPSSSLSAASYTPGELPCEIRSWLVLSLPVHCLGAAERPVPGGEVPADLVDEGLEAVPTD